MVTSTRPSRRIYVAYVPSAARIEAALLVRDGAFYVGARFHAVAADAAKHRRLEAERLRHNAIRGIPAAHRVIAQLMRKSAEVARVTAICPWCGRQVVQDESAVKCGGRLVHEIKCAGELATILED